MADSFAFASLGDRKLLSHAVETEIANAILARDFPPGAKLPSEFQLCEQFGVSRTAVREAIRMLSARGLISVEKGRGMFVNSITTDTVTDPLEFYLEFHSGEKRALDLVHARQIIEPPVAALAAANHSEEEAEEMRDKHEELMSHDRDFAELADLDLAFHLCVARASNNFLIPLLLEPIHRLMHEVIPSIYSTVEKAQEAAVEWHEKIFRAILRRDATAARKAMHRHLEIAEEHAREMLAKK